MISAACRRGGVRQDAHFRFGQVLQLVGPPVTPELRSSGVRDEDQLGVAGSLRRHGWRCDTSAARSPLTEISCKVRLRRITGETGKRDSLVPGNRREYNLATPLRPVPANLTVRRPKREPIRIAYSSKHKRWWITVSPVRRFIDCRSCDCIIFPRTDRYVIFRY